MTTRTNYAIQKSLDHLYLNQSWPLIGDATGLPASGTSGNLYAALLISGTECSYGSYTRVAIPRSASGFSRTNNIISNVAQINFAKATSGNQTANQIAIYDSATNGNQLHVQTLDNPIPIVTNVQPLIEAGALAITGS